MAENYFMQGVQVGANIASNRIEQSRRMQELKSQESLRRLQEQQVAQNLQLQMEQNNQLIQYRADMTKAMTAANLASSPIIPVATPMGPAPMPNPQRLSQTDAAYRFMLPVIAKYEPNKVPAAMQDLAMAEYRQNATALTQSKQEAIANMQGASPSDTQVKEFDDFSVVRTPDGKFQVVKKTGEKSFVPSDFEKRVADYEKRSGQKLSPDELKKYFDISMGAEPRAAVTPPVISEQDYIAKQLPSVRREDANQLIPVVRSDDERINELRKTYREIYKKADGENEDDIKARRERIRSDFRSGKITGSEATKLLRETGLK